MPLLSGKCAREKACLLPKVYSVLGVALAFPHNQLVLLFPPTFLASIGMQNKTGCAPEAPRELCFACFEINTAVLF